MGGRGRSRTQRKHFKDSREDVWKHSSKSDAPAAAGDVENSGKPNNDGWAPLATHNTAFEDYYKEQEIVAPEEWDDFIETLRKPLPAAFRINASSQFCLDIRTQIEDDFVKSLQTEFVGEDEAKAIRPLPWYPENFAWHSNYSRKELRKTQTLERFHEFLKLAHEIGNITRQEAVSMVPPLFLDVHPDHYVLDMCAAPGSKTFQLLEIIHRSNKPGFLPSGMVVANDVDVQRSNLLIHQTKRMCTANLMVTNHEAQNFPGCRLSKFNNNPSDVESANGLSINQLLFDRVLCDVPCSGDGTLRKAPDIWRRWNSGIGNGLHGLQLKIAMRGITLLKVGGRMVYSTCSMNPVENEAVVAEILRRCGDSVNLLDVSSELPQLDRRPGLKKWKVRDKGLWLSCYKDAPERRRPGLLSSMFPSGKNIDDSSENSGEVHDSGGNRDPKCESEPITNDAVSPSEVSDDGLSNLPLDHCMRIVPHDQNSGAFFIAVFYKRSPLPVQEQSSGVNGSSCRKAREISETAKNKLDGSARNLDEAKSGETYSYARPTDTETNETSLDNEPVQTLKDEVPEEQGVGDESGPEKTGTKRKLHIQGKRKVQEQSSSEVRKISETTKNKLDGSARNLDEAKSGETIPYARPIDIETNRTSLDNEPVQALKDEVPKEQGVGDEDSGPEKTGTKRKLHIQGKWKGLDPVLLFNDETVIDSIKSFYGIDASFSLHGHLVSRNSDTESVKRIYYISKSLKDVLELNLLAGEQLKIASVGLKMFERQTSKDGNSSNCRYRISSEGLPLLLPFITKQILLASSADFKSLLEKNSIKFGNFIDPELNENAPKLELGCCVVVLKEDGQALTVPLKVDSSTIAIGCWRGRSNVNVMVSGLDCKDLLERLERRHKANGISDAVMKEEKEAATMVQV